VTAGPKKNLGQTSNSQLNRCFATNETRLELHKDLVLAEDSLTRVRFRQLLQRRRYPTMSNL
jgi:hypothetical protein